MLGQLDWGGARQTGLVAGMASLDTLAGQAGLRWVAGWAGPEASLSHKAAEASLRLAYFEFFRLRQRQEVKAWPELLGQPDEGLGHVRQAWKLAWLKTSLRHVRLVVGLRPVSYTLDKPDLGAEPKLLAGCELGAWAGQAGLGLLGLLVGLGLFQTSLGLRLGGLG